MMAAVASVLFGALFIARRNQGELHRLRCILDRIDERTLQSALEAAVIATDLRAAQTKAAADEAAKSGSSNDSQNENGMSHSRKIEEDL